MERPPIYPVNGPEEKIVQEWIKFLSERHWWIKRTVGNLWQSGLPDLWIGHREYGHRWAEIKNPDSYHFTPAQLEWFPRFCAANDGVWVLGHCNAAEYAKLFAKPNWISYLHNLGGQ